MKREAWRIVKEKHSDTAFSGEGASRSGGRWNSRGVRVVYASSSLSLAALETLVHLNPLVRFRYHVFPVEFDDSVVEKIAARTLPSHWREEPPPPSTKQLGDLWVSQARSAVLELPSSIIPREMNYLLNPHHAGFQKIVIGKPEPFSFDPRLHPSRGPE